jgi:hypothetical protein
MYVPNVTQIVLPQEVLANLGVIFLPFPSRRSCVNDHGQGFMSLIGRMFHTWVDPWW